MNENKANPETEQQAEPGIEVGDLPIEGLQQEKIRGGTGVGIKKIDRDVVGID